MFNSSFSNNDDAICMKLIAFTLTISYVLIKKTFVKRKACPFFVFFSRAVQNRVVYMKGQIRCYADSTSNSERT
jgi:hypothetical protein